MHTWPRRGFLTIQRCEVRCNFCTGEAAYKNWPFAWFLRRHVHNVHAKGKYKGLRVNAGWSVLSVTDFPTFTKPHHRNEEDPRDGSETRRGQVKIEPTGSDDGEGGVPQTNGEWKEGPIPDFVTQLNFGNVDDATYKSLLRRIPTRATLDYEMPDSGYGNLKAEFPTLGDEIPFGMDHAQIMGELTDFINSATGFDGTLKDDYEEPVAEGDGQIDGQQVMDTTEDDFGGRFFLPDIEPDFDHDDDMPLADRLASYNNRSHYPTDQAHHNMMQMMNDVSGNMGQYGMDAHDYLPTMHLYYQAMHRQQDPSFPN